MIAPLLGFAKSLSASTWVIVVLSLSLAVAGATIKMQSALLDNCKASNAALEANVRTQNGQIAAWKHYAESQKKLVDKAASEARSAAQKWQARLDRAKNERPAVKPSDGPLAVCKGSVKWLIDQGNKLTEAWNAN